MATHSKISKKNKKLIKKFLPLCCTLLMCAIIILINVFVPLKYIATYFVIHAKLDRGEARLCVNDVNTGDSSLFILPDGKSLLVDGGGGDYQSACNIMRQLHRYKIKTLDYLICTTPKVEHTTGLEEIIKYFGCKQAFIPYFKSENKTVITDGYNALYKQLKSKNIPCEYIYYGQGAEGQDWFFTFLSPSHYDLPNGEYQAINGSTFTQKELDNASAITWLQIYQTNILLTSDACYEALSKITNDYMLLSQLSEGYAPYHGHRILLDNCHIGQIPYHGNKLSGFNSFIDFLACKDYLLMVGDNNADCPSPYVLSAIPDYARVHSTKNGNFTFKITSQGYTLI